MLAARDVPPAIRRPFVVAGYRPTQQPFAYYALSCFRVHNELLNIWTHLLPVFWFVWRFALSDAPHLSTDARVWPLATLYGGTVVLLVCSSAAHVFHSRSLLDHYLWFLVDFAGISLFALSIGLQRHLDVGAAHHPFKQHYVALLVVFCALHSFTNGYLFVLHTHFKPRFLYRLLSSLLIAVWLYVPLYPRYMAVDAADQVLGAHTRAGAWLLLSGVFMGGHVPERLAPGTFDIVCQGHTLFHVCVVLLAHNLLEGATGDYARTPPAVGCHSAAHVVGPLLLGILANVAVVLGLTRSAKKKAD